MAARTLHYRTIVGLLGWWLATIPVALQAATQGEIGATSTGDLRISVPVGGLVRISHLNDVNFGDWDGNTDLNSNQDICAAVRGGGGYQITARGDGVASAFTLSSGGAALPYEVYYNDRRGTAGRVRLTSGSILGGQSGASRWPNCQFFFFSRLTANLSILVRSTELGKVPMGAYTGVLTLTIAPE